MANPERLALSEKERERIRAVVEIVPEKWLVHLDDSSWNLGHLDRDLFHEFRTKVLEGALKNGIDPAALGALLLEMSAALWSHGMKRETFVRNAELWYDSRALAAPNAVHNAPGTKGTTS